MLVKKSFFKILAQVNKVILPRYSKRDLSKLSTSAKAIVAFRYWVTINALD
jgi:glutaredoxin 2